MNKQQSKFFQSFFAATEPLLENLLRNVCNELGHEDRFEEMVNKFLCQDKKKFTKILNKKSNTNKRRKTAYSMFLADKTVLALLKEQYPELNLSELNKKKGEYWRETVKQSPEILATYTKQAQEANEGKVESKPELVVEEKTEELPEPTLAPPTNTEATTPAPEKKELECPPAPKKTKKPRKQRAKKSKQ